MSQRRMERVNDLVKEVISEILRELKDPALADVLVSITNVKVTSDLSYAQVKVSVLAEPERRLEVAAALDRAAGFVRRQLFDRVRLRKIPQLRFELDDSLEQGARVLQLIRDTVGASSDGAPEPSET